MKTLLKITKSDLIQSIIFSDLHKNHRNVCKGTTKWNSGFRNFENPEEMWNNFKIQLDELKKTHNKNLFFLGDLSFIGKTKWIEELYEICLGFEKIYFIYGNHDELARENSDEIQKLFLEKSLNIEFRDYLELKITNGDSLEYEAVQYKNEHDEIVPFDELLIDFYKKEIVKKTTTNICMFHYPITSWNHKYRSGMMIHGHSHGACNHEKDWLNGHFIFDAGLDTHPLYGPYTIETLISAYNCKINNLHGIE